VGYAKQIPWNGLRGYITGMKNREIKQKIIDTCLWLQEKDLVIGTWGNVSVRVGDEIILTPSRISYDIMTVEDMVTIDLDGNVTEGFRSPTTEREVHRMIYRVRDDVGSIIHYHPRYASGMCATDQGIPCITEEMSQLLGGAIPITPEYIRAGEHEKLGQAAAKYIGNKNAVLLRNHAPVCVGADLDEAITCCQVLEKSAMIYMAAKAAGLNLMPIPDELIEVEHHRFKYDYGHEW